MPDSVKNLLRLADKNGYPLDGEGARLYLDNRLALAANPTDAETRRIAQHFEQHVFVTFSFADFTNGKWEEESACPECAAYWSRDAERLMVSTVVKDGKSEVEAKELVRQAAE